MGPEGKACDPMAGRNREHWPVCHILDDILAEYLLALSLLRADFLQKERANEWSLKEVLAEL